MLFFTVPWWTLGKGLVFKIWRLKFCPYRASLERVKINFGKFKYYLDQNREENKFFFQRRLFSVGTAPQISLSQNLNLSNCNQTNFFEGLLGHGQPPQNVSLFFKMSVNKLWLLILVNLRVLIRNLNVTKLENPQFLRNLRFLAFSGKIARPENPWFLGGLQNQKRPIPRDRALQNEQKNVLHQSPNFPRSKDMGDFVVKKVF